MFNEYLEKCFNKEERKSTLKENSNVFKQSIFYLLRLNRLHHTCKYKFIFIS